MSNSQNAMSGHVNPVSSADMQSETISNSDEAKTKKNTNFGGESDLKINHEINSDMQ